MKARLIKEARGGPRGKSDVLPIGTILEGRNALTACRAGQAEPIDEECAAKCKKPVKSAEPASATTTATE